MVLLLADAFLLLTQIMLWVLVIWAIWFFLGTVLDKKILGWFVLALLLAVIVLAFIRGGIDEPGSILEILWRLISFPLTPFGLGLILILVLLNSPKRLGKAGARIVTAVLILLALCSVPIVSYFLANELEMEGVELVQPDSVLQARVGERRVIALLGKNTTRLQLRPRLEAPPADPAVPERIAAATENKFQVLTQLPVQVTEQGDRIVYAAQLYQQEVRRGTSPLIVVSAGRRSDRRRKDEERLEDISEARDVARMLTDTFGVPAQDIVLDHVNGNIYGSAQEIRRLLRDQGINYGNQIILVTSAISMNRAAWTFYQVFEEEACIVVRPTDFYTVPSREWLQRTTRGRDLIERELQITDVIPTADAFFVSSKAIEEYLISLYHFLRGWFNRLPQDASLGCSGTEPGTPINPALPGRPSPPRGIPGTW